MIVAIGDDGVAQLLDAGDFRRFHVEAASVPDAVAVAGIDASTDPAEVWVAIDTLRDLPGERPAGWAEGLAAMIAGAAKAGWVDHAGTRIRAHVECPA